MNLNLTKTKLSISIGVAICTLYMPIANAATFVMQKHNQNFSIDGSSGAKEGQQLKLWKSKSTNKNQQWVQISRGNGYYSYKKNGTNVCWDGGNGGANRQAVTLEKCDSGDKNQQWKKIKAVSGTQIYRFQKRNASRYSIDGGNNGSNGQLMYLYKSNSKNVNQQWELTNLNDIDTGNSGGSTTTDHGLNASKAPSGNFDLNDWYLSVPTDTNKDGKADSIKEDKLNDGYESKYFYTGNDGGMVFKCTVGGTKTSDHTSYTRTELREMLRYGDTRIDTEAPENNWAFSSIPHSDQSDFGGIDGTLEATLAVNRVTTTSDNDEQVGRIIIGQIHAEGNEPIRLYYHKLPGNKNGSIYFAHETSEGDGGAEHWYDLLGDMIDSDHQNYKSNISSNPSNGIALNEEFSYKIQVDGDDLKVTISQDGKQLAYKKITMKNSGYDDSSNYMFFKAGIYLNDKTSDKDDWAQATFYKLKNSHDNYSH